MDVQASDRPQLLRRASTAAHRRRVDPAIIDLLLRTPLARARRGICATEARATLERYGQAFSSSLAAA